MSARRRALAAPLAGLVLFAACGLGAVAQLDALHAGRAGMKARGEPLYLPSASVVRVVSFGHASTAADLLHVWSIQYFGDRVSRRERPWIARIYGLVTDLDPHFRDAYWLGYVSLLVEARDPAAAFELADKALRAEPDFTLMAIEAALTARRLGDEERAVRYLQAASRATDDPLPLRLLTRMRTAETAQQELAEWSALLESDDELTRSIARSHVRDLTAHVDATRLEALVACHERDRGRPPHDLADLVTSGYLTALTTDPEGADWIYDRRARTVRAAKRFRWVPPTRARLGVDLSDLGACATALPRSDAP